MVSTVPLRSVADYCREANPCDHNPPSIGAAGWCKVEAHQMSYGTLVTGFVCCLLS